MAGSHFSVLPGIEIVRCAHENDRHGLVGFRPVNVGAEPDAVAHGHHHLLVNDGFFLQLEPNFGQRCLLAVCPFAEGKKKKKEGGNAECLFHGRIDFVNGGPQVSFLEEKDGE